MTKSGLPIWLACVMGVTTAAYGIIGYGFLEAIGWNNLSDGFLASGALQLIALLLALRGHSPAAFAASVIAYLAPTVIGLSEIHELAALNTLWWTAALGGVGSLVASVALYGPARMRLFVQPKLARKWGETVCPRTITGEHAWIFGTNAERGVTTQTRRCASCRVQAAPEISVETWAGGAAIAQQGSYQADLAPRR